MIICKTPFRVSFFGGGTDFPKWYKNNPSNIVSTTINKYCYVVLKSLPPIFKFKYRLRYHKTEKILDIKNIKHPSIKAIFERYYNNKKGLELLHYADLPAQSGLGASSAFTVSLINILYKYNKKNISKLLLAEKALNLEQNILKENIGSQDQYSCAIGGLNILNFSKKKVTVKKIKLSKKKLDKFKRRLLLVFTGFVRSAQNIEKDKLKNLDSKKEYYTKMQKISDDSIKYFKKLDKFSIDKIGELLHNSWEIKKKFSNKVSNHNINYLYKFAKKNGAIGGKLLGAGKGGFMIFVMKSEIEKKALNRKFSKLKKFIVDFDFENQGSKIVHDSENE